jgi:hypothetical protein
MKKFKFPLLTAALALAITFTLSCSDSGSDGGNDPIKKAKITGVSQKGPFVEGSKATLYELNESFAQTGRSFTDIIADNKGTFEIKNIELVSPYAMLEASGYYRNENTGGISKSPITLFAIADVREKDQVNVNILTHLEYYRVLNLVEGGKTVKEAKKQAQKEIFAVFGINSDNFKDSEDMSIFGTSESDAALLAISILLQGGLSEGNFSQRLTSFSQAIKTGGNWDNAEAKNSMEYWASENAENEKIKDNILKWGLSSNVPAFEKYIYDYWIRNWGVKECNAENEGDIVKYTYKNNSDYSSNYVCKNGTWTIALRLDIYCFESKSCGYFTDPRNGYTYRTETRGLLNQTWMIEPLRNEDLGRKCYNEARENGLICYDYYAIASLEEALLACPAGWRLPTVDEIEVFIPFGEPCNSSAIPYGGFSELATTGRIYVSCLITDNGEEEWKLEILPINIEQNGRISVYCVKD